jgi:hypothetical protein
VFSELERMLHAAQKAFLLFGVLLCTASAQMAPTASTRAQNLPDCLDGFGTCDHSSLTSKQAREIANLQHGTKDSAIATENVSSGEKVHNAT